MVTHLVAVFVSQGARRLFHVARPRLTCANPARLHRPSLWPLDMDPNRLEDCATRRARVTSRAACGTQLVASAVRTVAIADVGELASADDADDGHGGRLPHVNEPPCRAKSPQGQTKPARASTINSGQASSGPATAKSNRVTSLRPIPADSTGRVVQRTHAHACIRRVRVRLRTTTVAMRTCECSTRSKVVPPRA